MGTLQMSIMREETSSFPTIMAVQVNAHSLHGLQTSELYRVNPLPVTGVVNLSGIPDLDVAVAEQVCECSPLKLMQGTRAEQPTHYAHGVYARNDMRRACFCFSSPELGDVCCATAGLVSTGATSKGPGAADRERQRLYSLC
jgi:hypothetical protein